MIAYKFNFEHETDSNFTFNVIPSNKRVDFIRTHILAVLKKEDEEAYKAFNFRKFDFPDVIWQKPYNKTFTIFLKENSEACKHKNKLITALFKNPIKVNGKKAKLLSKSSFYPVEDILSMPKKTKEFVKYNIITPIILFSSKDKFPIYYSIITNSKSEKEKIEILKEKAKKLIIDNLKYQLQKQIGYNKYEVLDSVDINWNEFKIRFIEYHKGEKKTPAIFGSFSSSWELPRFVGQKIGKGFGQINKAQNFREKVA